MEARTVNSPPPTVSRDETIRCLLAIELSKKSWIVAVNTPLADKVSRHTLEACDWKGLLELIARMRTRVIQTLNRPVEVVSCYEAGYDGFWLHRLLEAHGVRNYVIDPASVQVNRRARRVKTDNIDCCAHRWRICAASRRCGVWCVCQVSPKKMIVGCIASVIA